MNLQKSLFKDRDFNFICEYKNAYNQKQEDALNILTNNHTKEFLFGGAAGGSKTWTGCCWLGFMCLCFPETKWFIGRADLQRIKKSTLVTFGKVAKKYGFRNEYKFNEKDSILKFSNGSQIDLLNCEFQPRDDTYDRFGSIEYTGGWLEEGGEINFGAFEVLKTRIGRHLNDKYGLTPKMMVTCNPKKNWMYSYFYKPYREGNLKDYQTFLKSFVTDNPFIDSQYIEQLKNTTDKAKKERLLLGNWEYDDNPYKLVIYDKILALWSNTHISSKGKYYITADVARFGSDYARVGVWKDWDLVEVKSFPISKTTEIQACINAFRRKYQIPAERAIADDDGIGGGVVDNCGIIGFVNNATPFPEEISEGKESRPQYPNLQTQCLVGLAEKINNNEILITAELSENEKEEIKEELDTIEQDPNSEFAVKLISKKEIKENIGRSPDWRDLFLMRKYFDYIKESQDLSKIFAGGL